MPDLSVVISRYSAFVYFPPPTACPLLIQHRLLLIFDAMGSCSARCPSKPHVLFPADLLSNQPVQCPGALSQCRALHLSSLNPTGSLLACFSGLYGSLWVAARPSSMLPLHLNLISFPNLRRVCCNTTSGALIKKLRAGPGTNHLVLASRQSAVPWAWLSPGPACLASYQL